MSINISSLMKSEKELWVNFVELFEFSFKMHRRLSEFLILNKIDQDIIDKFVKYKENSLSFTISLKNDCLWTISKDEPRSTHLRFIIAVLYSLKDIERITEYAYNITITVNKYKFSNIYLKNIISILNESNEAFKNLIEIFKKKKNQEKIESANEEISKFKLKFKEFTKTRIYKLELKNNAAVDEFFNFSIVIKYIERTIDHISLIFDNFATIKSI